MVNIKDFYKHFEERSQGHLFQIKISTERPCHKYFFKKYMGNVKAFQK